MAEKKALEALIRETIEDRLDGVKVVSLHIEASDNLSDDEVLTVRVIYDASNKLDGAKLAGVLRTLRPRLFRELAENRFPVMSFVSNVDAMGQQAGAA